MNILMKNKGISLIALVITIIILLILAGVSIGMFRSSMIDRTELTVSKVSSTTIKEKVELVYADMQVSKYANDNVPFNLKNNLEKIDGIDNVRIIQNENNNINDNSENTDRVVNNVPANNLNDGTYIEFDYNNDKYAFTIENNKIEELDIFLKGNVKVGDYINYPIEYDDVFSNVHYTGINGWRVIDDGVMTGTSGSVKIISSYIPAKFSYIPEDYSNNVDNAISDLINNFESKIFTNSSIGEQISIPGSYFNDGNFAKKVTTLTLEDLNYAHNSLYGTERESYSVTPLNGNDDLFSVSQMSILYWIASKQQGNDFDMYFMSQFGILTGSDTRLGIRPVIVLKDNLKGVKENGVWTID